MRIEPGLHAEHHRLGAGDVVDRDQQVGDVFHAAAVAERAEVVHRAREAGEQRAQLADRLGVAAGIDHEVLRSCACEPVPLTGQSSMTWPALRERALGLELVVDA